MDLEEITFTFPYPPYAIQKTFMRELYRTIELKKLGIFESPTGTGKSLSICCGALQWLQDNNKKLLEHLEEQARTLKLEITSKSSSDDWLQEEYENIKRKQAILDVQTKIEIIKKYHEKFSEIKSKINKQKIKINTKEDLIFKVKNTELCNKDVDEENEQDNDLILDDFDEVGDDQSDEEENDNHNDLLQKIFISSRTHSQLSQFLGEIKKTIFKDIVPVITLASRQHYCINSDINKLKNVQMINERCLDMQKSKTKSTAVDNSGRALKKVKTKLCNSCPYYNQANIKLLKERMLVDILDMEDLVKCGTKLKACPYYASRAAMDDAQVILISHAGIVSSGARSGNSLKLQNNILILDEAHGLTAALENAHTAPVTIKQINSVKTYLQFYVNKYRSRLSSKNLLSLNQFNFVIGKLQGILETKEKVQKDNIYKLEDFVIKAEIDHMNIRPLIDFCRNTKLAPKLHAFAMRYNQHFIEQEFKSNKKSSLESFLSNITKKQQKEVVEDKLEINTKINYQPNETSAGSGLYATLDFLQMLCERSENGRILAHRGEDGLLKYLLLNPAERFAEVVGQCRSVVVAGGTMEPMSEFVSLLTNNITQNGDDRITIVRCEHVVPAENVLGICLSKGPSNVTLNYCYENRLSESLLNETGRILRNICNIVPGGVVCFLPSYSYEKTVYEHMKKTNVIDMILKKKTVFREPKSAAEVDQVLNKFAEAVKKKDGNCNGALLLSVVGGKLSEGLNFSDDLGRCVLVIGMPYPNSKSPELQEKINYLNRNNGPTSGSVYYENLCMKAVNQCIGRAVRHANDYACVLLVDERYSKLQTTQALPSFVQKSLLTNCNFGPSIGSIAKFFSKHKDKSL